MPRQRKKATKLMNDAATRLANCKKIDPNLDLGSGQTNAAFEGALDNAQNRLDIYNGTLALADQQLNEFTAAEKALKDINERMLIGIGARYGKDSDEYEMAGGVRKSERKRPVRKDTGGNG